MSKSFCQASSVFPQPPLLPQCGLGTEVAQPQKHTALKEYVKITEPSLTVQSRHRAATVRRALHRCLRGGPLQAALSALASRSCSWLLRNRTLAISITSVMFITIPQGTHVAVQRVIILFIFIFIFLLLILIPLGASAFGRCLRLLLGLCIRPCLLL